MNLLDLFKRLSLGELSNLSLGNDGAGTIDEGNYDKLIGYTNDALQKLFTRFILKENSLILELQAHITNYHLIPRFAQSSQDNAKDIQYIMDLHCAPFKGDLIKILEVFDAYGCRKVLNDAESYGSLFTPQPHVLQVPNPVQGEPLSVSYQASHKVLSSAELHDQIEIPSYMENLLRTYVAYKVYCDMNGQENIVKGQEYLAAYEAGCTDIETKDLVNGTISTTNTKFAKRGWV
ncbi:putative tail protein [Rhizobium phage RHph_X2_28B]|uniref:virion structural protein n=1 Tax=Rhizobium phage RHph_X2_28B TaxID=2836086 RepID=UPI00232911C7|nr:virion structural protein [Rhizobium phage RHph_X2_28B]QWY83539.1 putative tail protein [Rhizobium phage RHph_X2_28B]QWY83775.1 putative tail protein [Rhizobium phage RHph_X3_15]